MEVLQDNQAVMSVLKYKLELLEQANLNTRCDSKLKELEQEALDCQAELQSVIV